MTCDNENEQLLQPAGEQILDETSLDPWDGKHDIEYWVWNGMCLVPASEEQIERIHENERALTAMWRLERWKAAQRRTDWLQCPGQVCVRLMRVFARRPISRQHDRASLSTGEAERIKERLPLDSSGV